MSICISNFSKSGDNRGLLNLKYCINSKRHVATVGIYVYTYI